MDKGFGDACLDEDAAAVSSKPPYHANQNLRCLSIVPLT